MVQTRRITAVEKQLATKQANFLRTCEARTALTVARSAKTIGKENASARAKEAGKVRLLKQSDEQQLRVKTRAELSAKRNQAATIRWNSFSSKKNQRVKAAQKTSNRCRKLLSGDGPKRIAGVIVGNSKHAAVEKLLTVSGQAQGLAKAAFLNCAEVEQLSELTKAFFQCLRTEFPDVSVTSKAHLLCSHVVGFVRCHGFWGLISEQSVESLHRKVNKDERRFASISIRQKILRRLMEESFIRNCLFDTHDIVIE